MKTIFLMFTIATLLGSCCPISKQFVSACDGYSKVILPRYIEYVKSDSTISDTTKEIRVTTANQFQRLIDSAQTKLNKK